LEDLDRPITMCDPEGLTGHPDNARSKTIVEDLPLHAVNPDYLAKWVESFGRERFCLDLQDIRDGSVDPCSLFVSKILAILGFFHKI
jgi:hypothetical protein